MEKKWLKPGIKYGLCAKHCWTRYPPAVTPSCKVYHYPLFFLE